MNFSCWLFFHNYYLLFAITFAAIDTVTASTECSRELSRQVRKTFVQEVYPQLSVSPEQLPVDCELNPLIDKFRIQEKQKTEVAMTDWQVKGCFRFLPQNTLTFSYNDLFSMMHVYN